MVGDRECPSCGKVSLIERGLYKWVCTNENCKEEFDEEYLDECDE